jgi:hypothetical protein
MNELSEFLSVFFGSALGIVGFVIIAILTACTILMPVCIYLIYTHTRKMLTLFQSLSTEITHHTKLLADTRKALQSMEAVGIEVEQQPEPQYTPPPVPQSIGPRRHQVRL